MLHMLDAVKDLEKSESDHLAFKLSKGNVDAGDTLVKIEDLVKQALNNGNEIENGIEKLQDRLEGKKYKPEHFGRVAMIPLSAVYSNLDIQRIVEHTHISRNILPIFDPRITQPINVVCYPVGAPHPITGETLTEEMYTAWDGQQTASCIESLLMYNMIDIDGEFYIKANVIDYDLEVPGSDITGEAVANFGFRTINGKGKKPVDPYYGLRSEANGKRLYGSTLQEDVHSDAMWSVMEENHMLPAPTTGTEKKERGRIAHVSGMKKMASHDTENFDIETFEKVIKFLSTYFSTDSGINSSFYMAIAELYENMKEQEIVGFNEVQFAQFIKDRYANGDGFSTYAKKRLHKLQDTLGTKRSWTDACSVPYMIADYVEYCEENNLQQGKLPIPEKLQNFVSGTIDIITAGE